MYIIYEISMYGNMYNFFVREWDALPQLQKMSLLKGKVQGVEVSFRLLENTVSFTPPAALSPADNPPPPPLPS
jgi:hypothetical protein